MKKALLNIGIIISVLAAALLMWRVVFPFLGWVMGGIFNGMSISFESISNFFQYLF